MDYEDCVKFYLGSAEQAHGEAIESWLRMNPEVARRARADAEVQCRIARHYERVLDEPVPPRLLTTQDPAASGWMGRLAVVAVVVLAASGGWWLGDRNLDQPEPRQVFATASETPAFREIAGYWPADTNIAGNVPHPDLSAQGYSLVGAQIMQKGSRPVIEFVYRSQQGERVTIYATRQAGELYRAPELKLAGRHVNVRRWRQSGVEYALAANMPPELVKDLAFAAAEVVPDRGGRPAKEKRIEFPMQPIPNPDELEGGVTPVSATGDVSST